MKRIINQVPRKHWQWFLGAVPFVIVIIFYVAASDARLAENPNDKLLPALQSFIDAIDRMAFEPSKRTGEYLFWQDTFKSLERLGIGMLISAILGLLFGVVTGAIPFVRAKLLPFFTFFSLIPPLAILPILFIIFGLGEVSKVVLIVIGVMPFIIRDIQQRVAEIPHEQLVKAQTLGGNSWQIILHIILPQVLPRLIEAIRLSLGAAWLFLIAAEAVAATEGLGYRIFLVRRYLAMDVIIPYVIWITLLAFLFDFSLKKLSQVLFPWFYADKG